MTITNPWNVSKRVLTDSFTYFESIMAELAVSITNQLANRNFSLILNSYNVSCNHTSSHVFLPQNTCKLSKFINGFWNILSHIQHDRQPKTQLTNSCHTRNQISFKYSFPVPFFKLLENLFPLSIQPILW